MTIATLAVIDPALKLISDVATSRVMEDVQDSPGRKSLFQIVAFDKYITSAIANEIRTRVSGAEVHVHPKLNDGTIPGEMLTEASATYFRNKEKSPGDGVIVFAVPTDHLDVVGATVGEIKQISEETLSKAPDIWIERCANLSTLRPQEKRTLSSFIQGAMAANLVTNGLRMLAVLLIELDGHFAAMPINRALDLALPALRIPGGAGRFKEFGSKGRAKSVDSWAAELNEIRIKAEDALYLRNSKGESVPRERLVDRLTGMIAEGRVTDDDAKVLKALVEDRSIIPGRWQPSQEAASKLNWSLFEDLLKSSRTTAKQDLGDETAEFFRTTNSSPLSQEDSKLLDSVVSTDDADEDERDFFFRHREDIKVNKKLLKRWESFVFRKTEQHPDLLSGILLAASDLVASITAMPEDPVLVIKLDGANRLAYWQSKNGDVCRYMRDRYRGLPGMLSKVALCDFGGLWALSNEWDTSSASRSGAEARQFKFDIFVMARKDLPESEHGSADIPKDTLKVAIYTTQLVWDMPANSLAEAYSSNMRELARPDEECGLIEGRFSRAQRTDRASDGVLDLEDRGTFQDVYDKPDGLFINVNDPSRDIFANIERALHEFASDGILTKHDADAIRSDMARFRTSYGKAMHAFIDKDGRGLDEEAIIEQSRLFGTFLSTLRKLAREDKCRTELWRRALSIGIASSEDAPFVAISCPWHPFRLAEAKVKAERIAAALGEVMKFGGNSSDLRTFARNATAAIDRGWHPTMSLVPANTRPGLLVETEHFAQFGLMEPPTKAEGADDAFEGQSREATAEFLTVAQEYLDLSPHERANFSVVLYNADNRDLPSRLADALARKIENETDLRCDLILTHTRQERLRQIYAEQNVTISNELDGVLASEAAQSFLSRLRVGFLDVDAVSSSDSRTADMVFLHDVIARSAQASWRRIDRPKDGWPSFRDHVPDLETRRRSHERGTQKTEVLLIPAVRPLEVQAYVDLVHDLHQDDRDDGKDHFVPVREIRFDDETVKKVIEQAHNVASWVVTYDGIADRQLLRNNDITVIRYGTRPGSAHNVIVSTKKADRTLLKRLRDNVTTILGSSGRSESLADMFFKEAATISGRVVLRAARIERNTFELMGLVLSKMVIADSLPSDLTAVAWIYLDDFVEWLGHPKGKRADILLVCIGDRDGMPFAELVVIEAKCVGETGEAAESVSSLQQTEASTNDLKERIVLDGDGLNRATWRGRLADLILEHGMVPAGSKERSLHRWADMIRSDEADIGIRGLSLVFIHDLINTKPPANLPGSGEQAQYLFDRSDIARILTRIDEDNPAKTVTIALPPPARSVAAGNNASNSPAEMKGTKSDQPVLHHPAPAEPTGTASPITEPDTKPDQAAELPAGASFPAPVEDYLNAFPTAKMVDDSREWLETTKGRLRVALRGYGLDAEIIGDRLTPNSALIKFRGGEKMTVAEVMKRRQTLMTSHAIDVQAARPGLGEVVVVVNRPHRAILGLAELWKRRGLVDGAPMQNGSFLIGERELDGELLYLNLTSGFGGQPMHGPHTLIAGETGGGKGVLTRNILLDLLATNSPTNARVRFVDPKMGADYPWLRTMPHLDGDIVTDKTSAIETLRELVDEMERRYSEITKAEAANIDRYNAKVDPAARLPRIYLFHDEIGDWMADGDDYSDAVSSYVVRLASKARAAGIHLFLITQRPDKDALPGQVKANINNKICLKTSSAINSNIVLDSSGAEELLGQGHFAARLANEPIRNQSPLIIGQAPFIDDDDAIDLADAITSHWGRRQRT